MDINYIVETPLGVLSQRSTGWSKELNIVNWNDMGGKYDICKWNPEHNKMGKGITLSENELLKLFELLKEYLYEDTVKTVVSKDKKKNLFLK